MKKEKIDAMISLMVSTHPYNKGDITMVAVTQQGNIRFEVTKGKELVIKIDLRKNLGKSKSGKSDLIASTLGNIAVEGTDGGKLGLNFYRPSSS